MKLSNHFISIKKSLILFFTTKPPFSTKALTKPFDSHSPKLTPPAHSLQLETHKALEWSSLCNNSLPSLQLRWANRSLETQKSQLARAKKRARSF